MSLPSNNFEQVVLTHVYVAPTSLGNIICHSVYYLPM